MTAVAGRCICGNTVVVDLDCVGCVDDPDPGIRVSGVLEHVCECFLHDPVGGEPERGPDGSGRPFNRELNAQAGRADSLDERGNGGQLTLLCEDLVRIAALQDAEQPAYLSESLARCLLDRLQGTLLETLNGAAGERWRRTTRPEY